MPRSGPGTIGMIIYQYRAERCYGKLESEGGRENRISTTVKFISRNKRDVGESNENNG
jgi:hypothetical protein